MTNSEFAAMKARIAKAQDGADLDRVERAMHRLWALGFFTVREFQHLDAMLCDSRDKIAA